MDKACLYCKCHKLISEGNFVSAYVLICTIKPGVKEQTVVVNCILPTFYFNCALFRLSTLINIDTLRDTNNIYLVSFTKFCDIQGISNPHFFLI